MSATGFSRSGLERLHRVMSGFVERGELPGLVALLSRNGDAHLEVIGDFSFDSSSPMRRDTIFRIASLTKPITAAAAMILLEDCRIRLDDPIHCWLPELRDRRVLRALSAQLDDTVPALREITVRDVLTYTMGFGSVMAAPGTYPIQKLIAEYHIGGDGFMLPTDYPTPEEWLRRLGSLPFIAQPGERWMYQVSGDLIGLLIARVSGQSFGAFLQERIFEPLGMNDTAFWVPTEKLQRLPAFYFFNRETNRLDFFENPNASAWRSEPPFESAGGGLVSTVDDYFVFSRMLLQKGRHGREQILSPASVELMTSDHLTPAQRDGSDLFFGSHSSWGLGVAVDIARHEIYHSPGRFGWTGGSGTTAYTDPANGMIGILFTQRMVDSPEPPKLQTDFWTLAYAAME
ncbi:MAG: beta-lactamase family protein [Candidatus Eremiobacteraeota bacterium]|nr:beta-lactamase family protein [Candidatus Eremiobacteraeota bacterium]MBV9648427.1 beta-lactamase family protein [Candidatus Eremiobacteraeota bacterium]